MLYSQAPLIGQYGAYKVLHLSDLQRFSLEPVNE